MRDVIDTPPPANGGYPADCDLHQMSDDGCPLGPDPTRWSDPVWCDYPTEGEVPVAERDDRGELGTSDDAPPPAAPAGSLWQMRRDKVELMERWQAACARMAGGGASG